MKAKIDLEKFICSLMKRFYETHNIDPITTECWLDKVLKDQGLKYKDGEIVEIPQESEDERIRKAIIESLPKHGYLPQTTIKVEDAMAWLEKQGEHSETSEEIPKCNDTCIDDERIRRSIIRALEKCKHIISIDFVTREKMLDWLEKQGEPKWTDEDEENLRDIISAIHHIPYQTTEAEVERTDWLKSLKQRMGE